MRAAFPASNVLCAGSLLLSLACPVAGVAAPARTAVAAPSLLAGLEFFQLDGAHSIIDFTVPWMGVSRVRGTFAGKTGTLVVDRTRLENSSLTVFIDMATLSTGLPRRDEHLKSADYFEVEKYPRARFTSTSIVPDGEGFRVNGNLTIKDVTKPVAVPFRLTGRVQDLSGGERIGFEGTLSLDRRDFGVIGPERFNAMLANGIVVGNEVQLTLSLEGFHFGLSDTVADRAGDSLRVAIEKGGVTKVFRTYRAMRDAAPDSLRTVDEGALNALGYWYLAHDRPAEAVAVFGLEAETYPDSRFAHGALSQAHAAAGDAPRAEAECKRAIALDAQATRAAEVLRRVAR